MPGVVLSAAMLATMIVHMETAFARFRLHPVFSIYPQTQFDQGAIFFPHAILGTDLVVERIVAYSGPFVEDDTNDDVKEIAALALCNRGTQPLSCARIELKQGTRNLAFQVQTILPGEKILVLEENRMAFEIAPYDKCTAQIASDDSKVALSQDLVILQIAQDCALAQNQTVRTLRDVSIEYRYWSDEEELYIGGITQKEYIGELVPGQTAYVYIDRLGEDARIVRITYQ